MLSATGGRLQGVRLPMPPPGRPRAGDQLAPSQAWGELNFARDATAAMLEQHVGTEGLAASLKVVCQPIARAHQTVTSDDRR